MEKVFNDILCIKGVRQTLLISPGGETLFRVGSESGDGPSFPESGLDIKSFAGFREVDLFFEAARLYVQSGPWGYLVVLMDHDASAAMVRLNCDALVAVLKSGENKRKRGRFLFRRKR